MTIRSDIAAALRKVVSETSGIGASWQYRKRTSGPSARGESFGSLIAVEGHQSGRSSSNEYDEQRQVHKRVERCAFRCSDAVALVTGDQLKDPAGNYWAITGIRSSGIGTTNYECERVVPLKAESGDRGGGP